MKSQKCSIKTKGQKKIKKKTSTMNKVINMAGIKRITSKFTLM